MKKAEVIKKIIKYQETLREYQNELDEEHGIIDISTIGEAHCDTEGFIKLAAGEEIKIEPYNWDICPFKAAAYVSGLKIFALCTAEDVEEIKKATCTVAE